MTKTDPPLNPPGLGPGPGGPGFDLPKRNILRLNHPIKYIYIHSNKHILMIMSLYIIVLSNHIHTLLNYRVLIVNNAD
jgi:hypothetical protein